MCDIIRCCHNADSAYLKPLPSHHFRSLSWGSIQRYLYRATARRAAPTSPFPKEGTAGAASPARHGGTRSETSGGHRFSAPTFLSSRRAAMETVPMSVKSAGASRFHRRTGAGNQKASTLTWPPFASCSPRSFLYCRLPGPTRFLLVHCFRDNIGFFFLKGRKAKSKKKKKPAV